MSFFYSPLQMIKNILVRVARYDPEFLDDFIELAGEDNDFLVKKYIHLPDTDLHVVVSDNNNNINLQLYKLLPTGIYVGKVTISSYEGTYYGFNLRAECLNSFKPSNSKYHSNGIELMYHKNGIHHREDGPSRVNFYISNIAKISFALYEEFRINGVHLPEGVSIQDYQQSKEAVLMMMELSKKPEDYPRDGDGLMLYSTEVNSMPMECRAWLRDNGARW